MSKYNFDLDMDSDNSCSIILKHIKPNSRVLEFGPAHGRMTKYMKEKLNCEICIVEKDYESGNSAKQFCDMFFIGDEYGGGDIDSGVWRRSLSNKKFDKIIFADVLEHIYDPWKALKSASELLNTNGSIWISIPNVAHNSVLIDLLNNKFTYNEVGLLDNTHIRFFTYNSLKHMIDKCGLVINRELNTRCAIEHTELNNSINDVPNNVGRFLNKREYGDVYQFVWELNLP